MQKEFDFHNTINLPEEELQERKKDARNLQDRILNDVFKKYPEKNFTPCEVHMIVDDFNTLLTSVRRAITNLTSEGKLNKLSIKRMGHFGTLNYTWELSK